MTTKKTASGSLSNLYFPAFKRALWLRMAVTASLFLGAIAWQYPQVLKPAIGGVLIGVFFLWSLMYTADHPRGRLQIVFSLTRMLLLAYLIVKLGHLRVLDTTVVICGFLSYKVGLVMEYARQAFPGLTGRSIHPRSPQAAD